MHIDFYERPHWTVTFLTCPRYFIASLPALVGDGAVLYLESYKKREELRPYLARHRAAPAAVEPVARASSRRAAWIEHLVLSPELVEDVESYFGQCYGMPAEHIHCYRPGRTLFWFHDAFTGGDLQITTDIAGAKVAAFCQNVAPRYQHAVRDSGGSSV